jgi:hypothetical protein
MNEHASERAIAERFLDEMFEAERLRDFTAWSQRWDPSDLNGLDDKRYQEDLDAMARELGEYRSRNYFGCVVRKGGSAPRYRFVWRTEYEKADALNIVTIEQRDSVWFVCENRCML